MARRIAFGVGLTAFVLLAVNFGLWMLLVALAWLAVYIGWGVVRWVWRQVVEYLEFRREEQRRLSGRN